MCSRSVSEGETASVLLRFFYGRYFSPTLKLKWSEQVIPNLYAVGELTYDSGTPHGVWSGRRAAEHILSK